MRFSLKVSTIVTFPLGNLSLINKVMVLLLHMLFLLKKLTNVSDLDNSLPDCSLSKH